MYRNIKRLNIILSGGGVKGIAFVGAFDVIRKKGYLPLNLAGVSAGAIAAALASAGYNAEGMWNTLETLEMEKFNLNTIEKKVPAVRYLAEYARQSKLHPEKVMEIFLNQYTYRSRNTWRDKPDAQRGIFQSIIKLCKDGCLFDGDLIEEWIADALLKKGIRTFADLRGGRPDESNPSGYKLRMTGVDCNRLKVVTLPDDAAFYGIEPDDLEVARAIRISTSVPFAFKPVVFAKKEGDTMVQYNLIDGGVLDRFPTWLMGNGNIPVAGFKLQSSEKKAIDLKTPLSIFKSLVSSVHDIGMPEGNLAALAYTGVIDTGDVNFLDFDLSPEQKQVLFESGRKAAMDLLI
jgi:NTE family protein